MFAEDSSEVNAKCMDIPTTVVHYTTGMDENLKLSEAAIGWSSSECSHRPRLAIQVQNEEDFAVVPVPEERREKTLSSLISAQECYMVPETPPQNTPGALCAAVRNEPTVFSEGEGGTPMTFGAPNVEVTSTQLPPLIDAKDIVTGASENPLPMQPLLSFSTTCIGTCGLPTPVALSAVDVSAPTDTPTIQECATQGLGEMILTMWARSIVSCGPGNLPLCEREDLSQDSDDELEIPQSKSSSFGDISSCDLQPAACPSSLLKVSSPLMTSHYVSPSIPCGFSSHLFPAIPLPQPFLADSSISSPLCLSLPSIPPPQSCLSLTGPPLLSPFVIPPPQPCFSPLTSSTCSPPPPCNPSPTIPATPPCNPSPTIPATPPCNPSPTIPATPPCNPSPTNPATPPCNPSPTIPAPPTPPPSTTPTMHTNSAPPIHPISPLTSLAPPPHSPHPSPTNPATPPCNPSPTVPAPPTPPPSTTPTIHTNSAPPIHPISPLTSLAPPPHSPHPSPPTTPAQSLFNSVEIEVSTVPDNSNASDVDESDINDGGKCVRIEGCITACSDFSAGHDPRPSPQYVVMVAPDAAVLSNLRRKVDIPDVVISNLDVVCVGSPGEHAANGVNIPVEVSSMDDSLAEPTPKRSKCASHDCGKQFLCVTKKLSTEDEVDLMCQSGVPIQQPLLCSADEGALPQVGAREHTLVINPVIHCGKEFQKSDGNDESEKRGLLLLTMGKEKEATDRLPSELISDKRVCKDSATSRLASEQLQMVPSWQQMLQGSPDHQHDDTSCEPSLYKDDVHSGKASSTPVVDISRSSKCWDVEESSVSFHQVPTSSSPFQHRDMFTSRSQDTPLNLARPKLRLGLSKKQKCRPLHHDL